jgi:GNAT superfamily N-acetyltransferase
VSLAARRPQPVAVTIFAARPLMRPGGSCAFLARHSAVWNALGYNLVMVRFRCDESVPQEDHAELWAVYEAVFGDYSDYQTWREAVWDKHSVREGFRIARAYDLDGLVGFAYGYTGEAGQWWTDNVRSVLEPDVAETWLGGHFELVSIGVTLAARQQGVGRGLMHVILEGLPHERLLLMTSSDPSDPARRLYASEGWQVLGPGVGAGTVTMGRRLESARS